MKKVRIAVLGLNHGYKFAKDALTIPGVELVAVAGDNDLSVERAKELNVPLYKNYKNLINECDLDGVIVTLPNHLHREATEIAARKGIHVLVEKPIADTVEDGEAMIQVCAEHHVQLMVGHHRRFSSRIKKLKEVIDSGMIGELVGVNMMWVLAKDRPYFQEKWRVSSGGGPLLINGIHDIDNLRYVTGLNIESVYAAARNIIRNHAVEDSASIILETTEGATINYFVSDGVPAPWNYEFNLRENPKYVAYDENCYYFFGTKGSISFPSFNVHTYDEEKYGWEHPLVIEKLNVEENDPMTSELLNFVDVLRGEAEPVVTGKDALETLKVLNAIRESAEKKQKMNIQTNAVAAY
ncbi:Gfo/Idh/MocA family protein [Ammoniphilus sp. 3BR4]|uniref:Gfo/Idh/MocA family protein n=1 Tax=Ammoniphilus sp. 3BR4 TaxID=3158265 RepID=UPI003465212E